MPDDIKLPSPKMLASTAEPEFLEAYEHWFTGQRQAAMDKALGVDRG